MSRVGFLFLSTIAHLYHLAPIAFELSRWKQIEVQLFISTKANWEILEEISQYYPDHNCQFNFVRPSLLRRIFKFKKRSHPKISSVLKNHLKQLLRCNALITPDKNIKKLYPYVKGKGIYTICSSHGQGYNFYTRSAGHSLFDFILVAGEPAYQNYISTGYYQPDQIKVVGYPKFDLTLKRKPVRIFNDDKPVILYNPHDKKKCSSWYLWGTDILEYFYQNQTFNLIFAPHVQLFGNHTIHLPEKYRQSSNIHIDLGSKSSCDMTYTMAADIYLGDISSQCNEFLYRPRPCVFLNPNGIRWQNNPDFRSWHVGEVIEKGQLDRLDDGLSTAFHKHPSYLKNQKKLFNEIFSLTEEPSGQRAAREISQLF